MVVDRRVQEGYKMTEWGEIPVEWEVKQLKDVLTVGYGKNQKEVEVEISKIPILGTGGIIGWSKQALFDGPSVLIGRKGTIDKPRYMETPFWTIDTLFYTDINQKLSFPKFIFYLFQTIDWYKYNEATGVPSLSASNISNINFLYPPLKEQQKIAEILSTVDEQIENTDQLIERTKELKKGLMQQLLTKGIGHKDFKQSELGEIPTDWEIIALEQDSKIIRGASPRPKGDPRYYGGNIPRLMIADITRDGKFVTPQIDFLTEEGAKKSRPMPKGTFVIACSGTYVGYPSILNVDACIHDGIIAIVDFENNFDIEYLYYVFTRLYNELNSSATHGGVFNNLTTQIIKEFKIVKPPLEEQQKITEILSTVDNQIKSYEQEKEKYTELKKGLMQQLLTGKIRVTV